MGKYYYEPFDITHYFSSYVGLKSTSIIIQSTGQSDAKTKYGVPTVRGQMSVHPITCVCNELLGFCVLEQMEINHVGNFM